MPEGNFYNPHYRIQIKEYDNIPSECSAKLINYSNESFEIKEDGTKISFIYPTNYGFIHNGVHCLKQCNDQS